jgi:hypothetical protein
MKEGQVDEEEKRKHKRCKKNEKGEGECYEKWERQNNYRKLYSLMPT